MGKLTEVKIRSLKAHAREQMIGDGDGLWLRVRPSGSKTWCLRRAVNGKLRLISLGQYPDLSLKGARDSAHTKRQQAPSVVVPRSVRELAAAYYAAAIEPNYKRPEQPKRYLDRDLAGIANMRVADVTRAHLSAVLADKRRGGKIACNRLLAIMRRMFRHGLKLGWVENDPAYLLDRSVAGGKEKARERVLSDDEIKKLWHAESAYQPLLRFLLASAQRIGEAQAAKWGDFKDKKWHIRDNKSDRPHWCAVTAPMKKVLDELPKGKEDERIFEKVTPVSIQRWVKLWCIREGIADPFTPHDLRRTAATRMHSLGVAPHVVEKILNHAMSGVMAIYNRADYSPERIQGQEKWATSLSKLIANTQRSAKPKSK